LQQFSLVVYNSLLKAAACTSVKLLFCAETDTIRCCCSEWHQCSQFIEDSVEPCFWPGIRNRVISSLLPVLSIPQLHHMQQIP